MSFGGQWFQIFLEKKYLHSTQTPVRMSLSQTGAAEKQTVTVYVNNALIS